MAACSNQQWWIQNLVKSSGCMNIKFFKEHLRKVPVTSKTASCGFASLIKLNPHACSLRERTTGAQRVGSRSAFCRTCVSIENFPMAPLLITKAHKCKNPIEHQQKRSVFSKAAVRRFSGRLKMNLLHTFSQDIRFCRKFPMTTRNN